MDSLRNKPLEQAEQALAGSENRFRALLEGVEKISVQGYDAERRVIFWNAASEQLYGYSRAEALGRPLEELIIPPPMRSLVIEATRQWLAAGVVSTPADELVLQHKNGSPVHVFSSHTMQRNSRGEAELYCVDIDLSERVRAEARRSELEAQLREAQKLEAMGTLAGGIAHDFNNILGAILGNVALALEQLPAAHPAAAHLGLIRIGGQRARSLVQQILAFSRRQPQELRVVQLQALVQESLALLRTALPPGVQLALSLAAEPVHVRADATQIQQVLINLCTNAWHALAGGVGRVEVGLSAEHHAGSPARAHLWVRDEGSGIDAATRSRLFEPFFTTKPQGQGTGLGLAVAHGIVLAHQGEIQVDSQPGVGSCFHLYLPLLQGGELPAEPAPEPGMATAAAGQGRHLVYVDDDEVMGLTVQALLQRQGYRVSLCAEPGQALSVAQAGGVDLLVTDYNMPGCTGLELVRRLALIAPALPVLMSSGHVTETLRAEAQRLGVRGLIHKEQTLEELAPLVLQVLGGGAPRRSLLAHPSALATLHLAWLAVRHMALEDPGIDSDTDSIDTANRLVDTPVKPKESIMQVRLIQVAAALVLVAVGSAQAAPQKVEQLPRVVITGKSVQSSQQIVQLPRVVIEGRSLASQPAVQMAAAKPARRS